MKFFSIKQHQGLRPIRGMVLAGFVAAIASAAAAQVQAENYAFLVAVADYDEKELRPLAFTRSDILEFHNALLKSGFKAENIVVMHDDLEKLVAHYKQRGSQFKAGDYLPEREKIRTELELMLGTLREDDSVIIAFAGHGVQFAGQKKSFYCPKDARLDNPESLISFEEIYSSLAQSRASRKMLLVDACQNDPQTSVSRSRSTVNLDSITRPQEETVPEGIVAMFSCRAGQKSFEHPPLGHGVFFYHVLQGWNGKADANSDGDLSYRELADYAERETASYAKLNLKALQVPTLRTDFSGEWVLRALTVGKPFTNSLGMKMVRLRGGDFMMGQPDVGIEADNPAHRVQITKPYYIGAHEVTVGQFRRFIESENYNAGRGVGYNAELRGIQANNPAFDWRYPGWTQTDQHPVTNVSWHVASDFCNWLSRKEGKRYRLPTEAEWEFACRGGTTTLFSCGATEDNLKGFANIADSQLKQALAPTFATPNYYDYSKPWDDGFPCSAPVGSFAPNPYGLYDMHGNLQEWCSDWHGQDYFRVSPLKDPTGPASGYHRVKRGGDWLDYPVISHSSFRRSEVPPNNRSHLIGFRVACDAE